MQPEMGLVTHSAPADVTEASQACQAPSNVPQGSLLILYLSLPSSICRNIQIRKMKLIEIEKKMIDKKDETQNLGHLAGADGHTLH